MTLQERILDILIENQNTYRGLNEANLHASEEIAELKESKKILYEYEMFFKSEPNDFCKIDGWYPIATDRIKNIDKVEEYINNGLLRRVSCKSH